MPSILTADAIRFVPVNDVSDPAREERVKQVALTMLRDQGVANIRQVAQSGIFKHPTGHLAASVRGDIDETGVTWSSDASYAMAVEHGVRPHSMWNLVGKTIPLRGKGGGKPIFRRVTAAAILAGKWHHPGTAGKFFMKKGVERTVREIPRIVALARKKVGELEK